jgi:Fe-S oxidoreductase
VAAAKFETPALKPYPVIPLVAEGAMASTKPFVASPQIQGNIGFPGELTEGWEQRAIAKMGELLGKYRSLQVYMDACVHCGACSDKCHYYLGTGDPKNMPVARQDLMRKVYRRYFTLSGKLFPKLVGAVDMTREVLDEWYSYYHQCSECRRCSVFCPYGIDTAEVTMAAREIMDSVGLGQKYSNEIIGKVHKIGNNLGLPGPALENTLEGLEEDVKDDTGVDVRYPIDVKGAEVLLITPSADFFAEPHVESLIGYGKVFHAAGISWTLSSMASEAGNFGMFIGNYKQPTHICELTYDLIQRGALRFDKDKNDDRIITFHDSCNVARASRMGDMPGGQFVIPREIIKAVANNFHDMAPGTIGEATFCCGGGGGLLTDDLIELRVKGALPRMEALKNVVDQHGVNFMATICAICKAQFTKVLPYYGFDMSMVGGVHQLVSKAIRLGEPH